MTKLILLAAAATVTILTALSTDATVKYPAPSTWNAATPPLVIRSIDEVQRLADASSLPVLEVTQPY